MATRKRIFRLPKIESSVGMRKRNKSEQDIILQTQTSDLLNAVLLKDCSQVAQILNAWKGPNIGGYVGDWNNILKIIIEEENLAILDTISPYIEGLFKTNLCEPVHFQDILYQGLLHKSKDLVSRLVNLLTSYEKEFHVVEAFYFAAEFSDYSIFLLLKNTKQPQFEEMIRHPRQLDRLFDT